MNKKIAVGVLLAIVAVAVLTVIQLNRSESQLLTTEKNEGQIVVIPPEEGGTSTPNMPNLTEYKTYKNEEVGISFTYPDIFQRVDVRVSSGKTGKKFSGILEFEPGHSISFGGVTEDYSSPRGGSIKDTLGYEQRGEQYFVRFIWGDVHVVSVEMWDTSNEHTQALVMRDTEIGHIFGAEGFAVFINIPNSEFQGIVFTPSSHDSKEVKILQEIIASITFN